MKTRKTLRAIRFCLLVIMVAVWWGTALFAQEKPTILYWQNGGIGQREQLEDSASLLFEPRELKLKSANTALALSLGGTLIPIGVGTAMTITATDFNGPPYEVKNEGAYLAGAILSACGVYFGPSFGYFYGGRSDRAWKGIGIRFGLAMATYAVTVATVGQTIDGPEEETTAGIVALVGGGFVLAHAVYDIAKVKGAVRKHNQRMQEKAWIVTPAYFAQHGSPGLELQIKF